MKIVDIFADQLSSFVYKADDGVNYNDNEYDRLMDLWTDVNYLRNYAIRNNVANINRFIEQRLRDAENIQDLLDEITENQQPLSYYFTPLSDTEMGSKVLSLQKGKVSHKDGLRIYAIRIDENCYVITGGAIKMSQSMQDHPDTNNELAKIKKAQLFLKEHNVLDSDSFYEFKKELE